MKRFAWLLAFILALTGCEDRCADPGLQLRQSLLAASGCSFNAHITADYGDVLREFSLRCQADSIGTITFEVVEPDSIAGITGTLGPEGGALTFDDQALAFPMLADGLLSPVSSPWVLLNALRGGYLREAGKEGEGNTILTIQDSYDAEAMTLRILLDSQNIPLSGEIYWENRRLLTIVLENFQIL